MRLGKKELAFPGNGNLLISHLPHANQKEYGGAPSLLFSGFCLAQIVQRGIWLGGGGGGGEPGFCDTLQFGSFVEYDDQQSIVFKCSEVSNLSETF